MNDIIRRRVFPTHVRNSDRGFNSLFHELAGRDKFRMHEICDDPALADIILFLDLNELSDDLSLKCLRHHDLVRKYRRKTFVYCEQDQPWCVMQGLYVSMPASSFQADRQRAMGYIAQTMNGRIDAEVSRRTQPKYLFSFVGRGGNKTRLSVLRLNHPEGFVRDTSHINFFEFSANHAECARHEYAQSLYDSCFVLCPRGAGTSSYRLYEAMQAGRVPVIISDDWVPPRGPSWDNFSLRCDERDVGILPRRLEALRERSAAMGKHARSAWEEWFSPDTLFHRMVEECSSILTERIVPEWVSQLRPSLTLRRLQARSVKANLASWLKSLYKRVRQDPPR